MPEMESTEQMTGFTSKWVQSLRARWVGEQLRDLRHGRDMTLKLVATQLRRDLSALGRYERGEWPIVYADVVTLLDLYGVHDVEVRESILRVARDVWRVNRWVGSPEDPAELAFLDVPWLVAGATRVCSYHPTLVPDLVRTPEYALRVIGAHGGGPAGLRVWEERHRVVTTTAAVGLVVEVVIDETALRRRSTGDRLVLADQYTHLAKMVTEHGIRIRVLPAGVGFHPGSDGPFTVYHQVDKHPPVGHLQGLGGDLFIEAPQSAELATAFDGLWNAALTPEDSARLIESIAHTQT
jgi:transcriptional regulator with XRE-family HTH domain